MKSYIIGLLAAILFQSPSKGFSETPSPEQITELRKTATQGNADAQCNLGLMYYNGEGVPQNKAEAIRWYRLSAKQGLVQAQNNLGLMYSEGQGVHKTMQRRSNGIALRLSREMQRLSSILG